MKILATIFLTLILADDPPTSRIRLFQSGTIPAHKQKVMIEHYEQFGCRVVGVFDVAEGLVNVYCLDMLVAE